MTTGFFRKAPAAAGDDEAGDQQQRPQIPPPQQHTHSPNTLASMKRGLLDEVLQKAKLPNGGLKSGAWKQVSSGPSPSELRARRTSGGGEGNPRKSGKETKDTTGEEKGTGKLSGKGTKGKKVEMTIHLTKN